MCCCCCTIHNYSGCQFCVYKNVVGIFFWFNHYFIFMNLMVWEPFYCNMWEFFFDLMLLYAFHSVIIFHYPMLLFLRHFFGTFSAYINHNVWYIPQKFWNLYFFFVSLYFSNTPFTETISLWLTEELIEV